MKLGALRGTLLATCSAAALLVGGIRPSEAACTYSNASPPIDNTAAINCITFNNGTIFSGNVTNGTTGTITPSGLVGTGSGTAISVLNATTLNGTIQNSGAINSTLAGAAGIFVINGSVVTGSIINGGSLAAAAQGIYVLNSTVGGSVSNAGTISGAVGILVQNASIGDSVANTGAINFSAFTGMSFQTNAKVAGDIVNGGSITRVGAGSNVGIILATGMSVGGSVINTGTINGGGGILGFNGWTVAGNVSNGGTITASSRPGFSLLSGTVHGAVVNSGTITVNPAGAQPFGIRLATNIAGNIASVAGGITNTGSISAATGIILQSGAIAGTIANSGTLTGTTNAINLLGEGALTTIDQTAGTITGAILLSSLGDTVNIAGGTINGDIVGTGASGTVNFNIGAGNTYTYAAPFGFSGVDQVNINSGTVVLNGANSASVVDVNNGGTLAGTGSLDPLVVNINSGGTLAPGPPGGIGTFTITGSLVFATGSFYMVLLGEGAGNNSLTNVNGTATLNGNGTVVATLLPGRYEQTYRILDTTGGVIGQFAGLAITGDFVGTASLNYTLNAGGIDIVVSGVDLIPTPPGASVNQSNVVNAINNAILANPENTPIPAPFDVLATLSGPALLSALSQLSGESATAAERAGFGLMNEFLGLMLDPYVPCDGTGGSGGLYCRQMQSTGFAPQQRASLPPDIALAYDSVFKAPPKPTFEQRWTAWAAGFGGSAAANGDPTVGSNNVTTSTYGYAAGLDYRYSPDTVLGFSLAGGGTNWNLANALGTGRSDAFLAGIYGVTHAGPWYLGGALAFANNWFTTDRTALGDQLTASFQGQSYAARLEGGYRFVVPINYHTIGVTPYAAVQAQDFHTPAYSETDLTGGGFGLSYNAMNGTDTRSELGGRFDDLTALDAMPLLLRARLAWGHDWVSNPALNATFESLPGGSGFTVFGAPMPHDSALASAGGELFFTPNWSFLAKFDGEFASSSQTYAGSGTLRYTW